MPLPSRRKQPFSVKKKSAQLQLRRERKRNEKARSVEVSSSSGQHSEAGEDDVTEQRKLAVSKINEQPSARIIPGNEYDPNRYRLHFQQEGKTEIEQRKKEAAKPITFLAENDLEVELDVSDRSLNGLGIPKRQAWDYSMSKDKLDSIEERYFVNYLNGLLSKFPSGELSYFEMNLETWRQLWRVLEMSDVVLIIADARHPTLHFSPSLYCYITCDLKKSVILVLNKTDLSSPAIVAAWKHYFSALYPGISVVCFTSFPFDSSEDDQSTDPSAVIRKRRRRGHWATAGLRRLYEVCAEVVGSSVDLSAWADKINAQEAGRDTSDSVGVVQQEASAGMSDSAERFRGGVLTIGCCGFPNVGKSSLMNGIVGKKVVSVSRTPGHTKHFQTIYITPNVRLCDSPGLVCPSLVPKPLQILSAIYPVAQVREPYSAVGYLAARVPLGQLLKLNLPKDYSAMELCSAWAEKRGYITAKAARPDTYRAANGLLRMVVSGQINLCLRPKGYTAEKDTWARHPDTLALARMIRASGANGGKDSSSPERSEDEESSEETDEKYDGSSENTTGSAGNRNPFAALDDDE